MKYTEKNIYAILVAILAVMVFSMAAACKDKQDNNGDGSGDFDYRSIGDSLTITGYKGKGGNVTIPEKIEGTTVHNIGHDAFANNNSITGVTFPKGITMIREKAFYNCVNLEKIIIESSVVSVFEQAFSGCTKLTSVEIQGKATIYEDTFLGNFYAVYYATDNTDGTPGKYQTTAPVSGSSNWHKVP